MLRPADTSPDARATIHPTAPITSQRSDHRGTTHDDGKRPSPVGPVILGVLLLSLVVALILVRGNSDPDLMPGNDQLSEGVTTTIDEESPEEAADVVVEPDETDNTDNTDTEPAEATEIVNPAGAYVEPTTTLENGMVILAGGQPDQTTADRIAGEVAAIVGAENVTNNFVLDTRAPVEGAVGLLDSTDSITYIPDSFRVDETSQMHLELAAYVLDQNPDTILTITSHVASRGDEFVAAEASQANADRLVVYFSERGIDTPRLVALGLGSAVPVDENAPELAINQRSYLTISVP